MKKLLLSLFLLSGFLALPCINGHATINTTVNKNIYSGDGTTVAWPYTFTIIASSDIQVYTVDPTGNQTLISTNYSINTYTKIVTYPVTGAPLAVGYQIVLLRVEPLTQQLALSNQGNLPAKSLEQAYDKGVMISQQLQEQINRAILAPLTSNSNAGYTLPAPLANAYLGWDATGSFLTNFITQGLTTASTPTFAGLTISTNNVTLGNLGGILKASAGVLGTATADGDYSTPTGTESFTNKTYDTNGTGNVFKIHGTTFTGSTVGSGSNIVLGNSVSGNSGVIAQSSGAVTANHCAKFDASGNLVDNGSSCSGGSGMTYPASAGFAVSDTSSWLTSISTSGGIKDSNLNWTDIKSIGSKNINWTDVNGIATISGGINWTGIQGIIKSQNINWNDLNGFAKLNASGINWNDINKQGQINRIGINWTDFPASGIVKFNGASSPIAAVSGTDYAPATTSNAILYGNNLGGFSNATVGAGLTFSAGVLASTTTNYAAGDYLLSGPSDILNGLQTSITKIYEIYLPRAGTLRIRFGGAGNNGGGNFYGQIYRNGSAVGTLRTFSQGANWVEFSEDISGWSSGDLLQLYAYSDNNGWNANCFVGGLRIYENAPQREIFTINLGGNGTHSSPLIWSGSDVPNTMHLTTMGSIGDLYTNKSGGTSTTLYVKTGTTTWTAK